MPPGSVERGLKAIRVPTHDMTRGGKTQGLTRLCIVVTALHRRMRPVHYSTPLQTSAVPEEEGGHVCLLDLTRARRLPWFARPSTAQVLSGSGELDTDTGAMQVGDGVCC
jgi:hypothetical protein